MSERRNARHLLGDHARSRSLPGGTGVAGKKIVLALRARAPATRSCRRGLGVGPHTIGKLAQSFHHRSGSRGSTTRCVAAGPRTVEDEAVAELITQDTSRAGPQGPQTTLERAAGIAKRNRDCQEHRPSPCSQLFGLQPHRTRSFKLFDPIPSSSRKLRDVVGLYLNPPDQAGSGCFVSMRRARSRPSNAPSPCFPWGSATSKASPHGLPAPTAQPRCSPPSTCLTAAGHRPMQNPAIATRSSSPSCGHIEANVPTQLDVPSRRRQLRTHKHPQKSELGSHAVPALAHSLHALPTPPGSTQVRSASFAPHHPTRPSVVAPSRVHRRPSSKKIDRPLHPQLHNANSQPFVWTATADSILQKLQRLCQRIFRGRKH